jgi:hypothetical protein
MEEILIKMFKKFNKQSNVTYYVDPIEKEVRYSDGKHSFPVTGIDQVESAADTGKGLIILEAGQRIKLTAAGPEEVA